MHSPFFGGAALLSFLFLSACVKTEIVPETLDPVLRAEPATVSLIAGQTRQLSATFTNEAGQDQSAFVNWSIANTAIATINATGLLSAQSPGQTWAIAAAPGGLSDSVLVTVVQSDNAVASVVIQDAPNAIGAGATLQLSARVYNAAGAELPAQTIGWSTTNAAVLQVSSNGLVTGIGPGTASVTATAEGIGSLPFLIQVIPAGGLSRSGTFSGNMGYSVSGTATLEQNGSILKLTLGSDFLASNGPQLGVYLAKNASGGLNSQNSLKLGNLQQNSGMQEYAVPAGVTLTDYDYVVVYCIPFNVRFGTAKLM